MALPSYQFSSSITSENKIAGIWIIFTPTTSTNPFKWEIELSEGIPRFDMLKLMSFVWAELFSTDLKEIKPFSHSIWDFIMSSVVKENQAKRKLSNCINSCYISLTNHRGNSSQNVNHLTVSHLFWFNMLPHGGDMLLPTPTPFFGLEGKKKCRNT